MKSKVLLDRATGEEVNIDSAVVERIKDGVLRAIRELGGRGVSMAELMRVDGIRGEYGWEPKENLLLWTGMSAEGVRAMGELIDGGSVKIAATTVLIYLFDGMSLKLPIAKQVRSYKKPRWLPIALGLAE